MEDNKLKMNLQYFANEGDNPGEGAAEGEGERKGSSQPKSGEGKTLTEEEANRLIAQQKSKAKEEVRKELEAEYQKKMEKEIAEAERLAKMNEDERAEEEVRLLKEELEQLRQKENYNGLSREASNMLAEHGIQADDTTLQFVVKDDADTTKEAVGAFVGLINAKVEEGVKKALSGNAPRVGAGNKGLTYDSIMDIKDTEKRQKLIKENLHLFK